MRSKIILLLIVLVSITSCQLNKKESNQQNSGNEGLTNTQPITIRIVLLPLIDTLPIYVADKEGLFSELNIKVTFIPVSSASERDQILAAGKADATINETLSDMFFNRDSIKMVVVRYAYKANSESAHFYILVSSDSNITKAEQLANVPIGISEGTIIEYVTDRLLQNIGIAESEIETVSIPKMPDRMSLLASGELKAAVLPDPLASLAIQQGATAILDDRDFPSYGASVISFTKDFIDENPSAVRDFLSAIEKAVVLINNNPKNYSNLLSEKKLVPASLVGSYEVPAFPESSITSEAEWNDVLEWAKGKVFINTDISYSDSVNSSFLP